jgi:hypothetical protein
MKTKEPQEMTAQFKDRIWDLKMSFAHRDPERTDLNREALMNIRLTTSMMIWSEKTDVNDHEIEFKFQDALTGCGKAIIHLN